MGVKALAIATSMIPTDSSHANTRQHCESACPVGNNTSMMAAGRTMPTNHSQRLTQATTATAARALPSTTNAYRAYWPAAAVRPAPIPNAQKSQPTRFMGWRDRITAPTAPVATAATTVETRNSANAPSRPNPLTKPSMSASRANSAGPTASSHVRRAGPATASAPQSDRVQRNAAVGMRRP